jgi:transposase InsO family protein
MATGGVDQGKGEDLLFGERSEKEHVHGIVQRTLQRREWGLFFDAKNMWELRRAIAEQIEYYNVQRRHSALGYVAPWAYIKQEVTLPQPALDLAQISS